MGESGGFKSAGVNQSRGMKPPTESLQVIACYDLSKMMRKELEWWKRAIELVETLGMKLGEGSKEAMSITQLFVPVGSAGVSRSFGRPFITHRSEYELSMETDKKRGSRSCEDEDSVEGIPECEKLTKPRKGEVIFMHPRVLTVKIRSYAINFQSWSRSSATCDLVSLGYSIRAGILAEQE
ncbi:uncharacterized protein STEHIDRAFT_116264 [Stereum hirsutum FP-91666 SS1]|uniref:Uncharacterized protein n=1 Tax=Stereum hirsutum (strain FP-91666) TaxID=721885 RepID=R7RWN0_STEHR|nr:uncharacterized protein STEHIDRAFT_116264 [Stereum hirsutum FP-91666 SS1]EIM79781.1 hypothetical protein STEHIDRAFT_116264 [Stereum hirsutum FP-91666 SS1]